MTGSSIFAVAMLLAAGAASAAGFVSRGPCGPGGDRCPPCPACPAGGVLAPAHGVSSGAAQARPFGGTVVCPVRDTDCTGGEGGRCPEEARRRCKERDGEGCPKSKAGENP